jgi:hypothetical protein
MVKAVDQRVIIRFEEPRAGQRTLPVLFLEVDPPTYPGRLQGVFVPTDGEDVDRPEGAKAGDVLRIAQWCAAL